MQKSSKYDIFLTPDELAVFEKFKHSDVVYLSFEEYKILVRRNLIHTRIGGCEAGLTKLPDSGLCELNRFGMGVREFRAEKYKGKETANRRFYYNEIRAWGTFIIALAAFIKSFFY